MQSRVMEKQQHELSTDRAEFGVLHPLAEASDASVTVPESSSKSSLLFDGRISVSEPRKAPSFP